MDHLELLHQQVHLIRTLIPNHQHVVVVLHSPPRLGGLVTLVNLCTKISGCVGLQMHLNLMGSRIRLVWECKLDLFANC